MKFTTNNLACTTKLFQFMETIILLVVSFDIYAIKTKHVNKDLPVHTMQLNHLAGILLILKSSSELLHHSIISSLLIPARV